MDISGPHDPDDWFDDAEPPTEPAAGGERVVRERPEAEDWLREPASPARTGSPIRIEPRVLLVAALGVCLLLGILASAGVFSSGRSRPAALPTTSVPRVTTPTTTATPRPKPTRIVPTTPLSPGDTGAAVNQLQRALKLAGYSPGTVDGNYGTATTQAVKSFQAAHGLTADGIAGAKTLAALENTVQGG